MKVLVHIYLFFHYVCASKHQASMHPCVHASMIHASMHPCIHASMQPCIHTSMHPCTHSSIHPCINASIHPCPCTAQAFTVYSQRRNFKKLGDGLNSPETHTCTRNLPIFHNMHQTMTTHDKYNRGTTNKILRQLLPPLRMIGVY